MAFIPVVIIIFFHLQLLQGAVPSSDLGGDRKALLNFAKNIAITGAGPRGPMGWSPKPPICKSWVGVHCSSTSDGSRRRQRQRVVGVNLGGYGVRGAIPEKTIGRLDALETLYLENNRLTGAIPADLTIKNIPKLKHLNLSNNRLTGSIHSSLSARFPPSSFANNSLLCGPPMNPEQQPPLFHSVDHSSESYTGKKTKFNLKHFLLVVVLPFGVGLTLLIMFCWCRIYVCRVRPK
ncbi:unnamed protein product [Cuscuta europaea]|uniref:Leucine-rich repeat-containing N-terminal plant-type domain-containing protein n=1 Tax=Cuscuta europaea TaxID=41803 RepID=A0A9P0YXG4_CUSEU|nr:unnamed protein product [Cuscuta europaea]